MRNAGKWAFGTKGGQRFFLLNGKKMYSTKLTLYLKSRVVMEPRFGSHDDGLTIYVQRSAPLVDDVILTITSQFDNRLGKTKKES